MGRINNNKNMERFTLSFRKMEDGRFFCLAKETPEEKLDDINDRDGNNIECCQDTPGKCADLLYKLILAK